MIELETRKLKDVPIGGVFIADDRDFFNPPYIDKEPFVKTRDFGCSCGFADLDGGIGVYAGDRDAEVAYTGVILND